MMIIKIGVIVMKRMISVLSVCLIITLLAVTASAVIIKPGINMFTGTDDALTGENAVSYGYDTNIVVRSGSTLGIGTNPDSSSDKVLVWNVPPLDEPEASGESYPTLTLNFGGKLDEILGHTNIHVKLDINKTAIFGENDTYKHASAFWIMNSSGAVGNKAYEGRIVANEGWQGIDSLIDMTKRSQTDTATDTLKPTSLIIETSVYKCNTKETTYYLDNMYAVPAYEFKYYNADGTKLLKTEYKAFDENGNIITSYTPQSGVFGDMYVSSWSTVKGGSAVNTVSLSNKNVSLYAKDYSDLVTAVVYDGNIFSKTGETKRLTLSLCDGVEYNSTKATFTSSDTSVISATADATGAMLKAVGEGSANITITYEGFTKTIEFSVVGEKIFTFDFDGADSTELALWTALDNDGLTFNYNAASNPRDTVSVEASSIITLPEITKGSATKYRYLVFTAKAEEETYIEVQLDTDSDSAAADFTVTAGDSFKDYVIDLTQLGGWKGNNPTVMFGNDNEVEFVRIAFLGDYVAGGELKLSASGNYLATPGRYVTLTAEVLSNEYGYNTAVEWSISGDTDAVFFVDNGDGTAIVAARAKKGNVTVTAKSVADNTKTASAQIEIDVDADRYIGLFEGFDSNAKMRTASNVKASYDAQKKIYVIDSIAESNTSFYFDGFDAPDMTYKYLVYNAKNVSEANQKIKIFFKTTADSVFTESKARELPFNTNSDGTYTAYCDLSTFTTFTAPVTADLMHGLRPKISSIELMSMYLTDKKPTDKDTKIVITSSSDKITEDMGSVTLSAVAKTSLVAADDEIKFKLMSGNAKVENTGNDSATVTATVNGTVKVGAYLASNPSNVTEYTIEVSGQREKIATYDFRYLAFGHSYLRHGTFTGWPWPDAEKGNRGMAASSYDKDYFARFKYYLMEEFDGTMYSEAINIAEFERLCVEGMTKEKYKASSEYQGLVNHIKKHNPNLMTIYVGGGNTKANDYDSLYLFYDVLFELVTENVADGTLVIAANHRTKIAAGQAMMAAAEKYGIPYSDLSFFTADSSRNNPYYAYNQYPEYDTYRQEYYEKNGSYPTEFRTHPGDVGHDALGKGIFETTKDYVAATITPTYVYLPEALAIDGASSVSAKSTYTAKASPSDASARVSWSVDNENIATINEDGVLTPVNNGTVTITAMSVYNDTVATKTVTVTGQTPCYTVTYKAGTSDAVTGLPESFKYAKDNFVLASVYPERAGYKFGGWSLTKDGETVKSINVTGNTEVYATWIFADRFDFEDDSYNEGVVFNGFNVFIKDGLLCGNSAPGTGFSVARENLKLDSSVYGIFAVKMLVATDTTVDISDLALGLTVNTTDGKFTYSKTVTPNEMTEYVYDISDVTGTITGFIISPNNLECNGNIDYIAFSAGDDVVTDAVFEIVGGECDTYTASFGKNIGLCTLIAAAYDEHGKMVGIDIIKKANDADGVVTVKVAKSLNSHHVKVMAFDVSGNLKVISKEAVSYQKQ